MVPFINSLTCLSEQVCAPTGAGKTNIAMIAVLHEVCFLELSQLQCEVSLASLFFLKFWSRQVVSNCIYFDDISLCLTNFCGTLRTVRTESEVWRAAEK